MKCPTCVNALLVMSERQGVEIDYCPQCRGVWLDRGELDKLLERAAAQTSKSLPSQVSQPRSDRYQEPSYPPRQYEQSYSGHKKHYHHKSWLSEIFD
jgi:Zn-finger nucleic acid-binding protein